MDLPEPFLGRLVIQVIKEDASEKVKQKIASETKVSSEFLAKFEMTDIKGKVPISKGKIVKKAPDAFGSAFTDRYGDVGYTPTYGDIILFIPNESYKIDAEDTHHIIADTDIIGYIKSNEPTEV
jgi:hypothetical protein